ncbi:DUF3883 domain-containing protein [Flavobacteriaceae bacterium R38]|nr:DUF3883 domain-containing protein [Flavobacteriaceae bacterium R38]
MDNNHKLALYVGYYLSRFNKEAYYNLGFKTQKKAHQKIGAILKVNPNTIKNMRDEFDPIHGFRVGWHQRPMSPSRLHIVNALEKLNEFDIRGIINDILTGSRNNLEKLLKIVSIDDKSLKNSKFILRGSTGKKAEEYFINYHSETSLPINGQLKDTRDLGCGYDFEVHSNNDIYYVEVKGLAKEKGGLLFTNKEWSKAKKYKEKYFVVLVKNIDKLPQIEIFRNPVNRLSAKKNLYTSINIQWIVSEKELR